jgi:hypothetical protein
MADLSKLRKKIKPVIAATGSTVLVAGLLTSCFPAGNLLPPPMDLVTPEEVVSPPLDWTSGNLMAPDMMEFDAGVQDEGSIPFDFSSGNLMAPDVQALDEGPPPKDVGSATDEGTAVDEGPPEPDIFISGNLMPPDVQELPSKDVQDSTDEGKETPAVPLPSDDE